MKKKETDFEELMKNVDYTRWLQALIPVMQPIIIFGAWLGFSMFDKKASAVSKLIAICEPIPTIDLNVPRPVVLAALYHSTDEALKILADVIEFFENIEIPSADEIIDDIKEEVKETFIDPVTEVSHDFQTALGDCAANAREKIPGGALGYRALGPAWIVSCMIQKGYSISLDYVKDKLF